MKKESELSQMINELPGNRPLYQDSGSWQIRSDDMENVIFEQGVNESFYDFIKRAHSKENYWTMFKGETEMHRCENYNSYVDEDSFWKCCKCDKIVD